MNCCVLKLNILLNYEDVEMKVKSEKISTINEIDEDFVFPPLSNQ